MEKVIHSELFGKIHLEEKLGFTGTIKDNINDRELTLDIFEDVTQDKDLLSVQAVLDNYIALDKHAKQYILEDLNQGSSTAQFYYDFHKEELAKEFTTLLAEDELTNEKIVSHTFLESIWFSADKNGILATFDYKLLPQYSDEILAVRFDHTQRIIDLAHES